MPVCNLTHLKKDPKNHRNVIVVPCQYIAGNCISNPMNQGGFEAFLRATYPYYHGATYESSKTLRLTPIKP